MKNKKYAVLELFFNSPKHWHFEEMLKKAEISRPQLMNWLDEFQKQGIIKRVKKKGKMPYYIQDFDSPSYKTLKRLYAQQKLTESGFIEHLMSLKDIKTAIIFASFSRSDWYEKSDIDLFVYGPAKQLKIGRYETILHRDIQLFICKNEKELKRFGAPLLRNILQGNLITGIVPKEVIKNAAI